MDYNLLEISIAWEAKPKTFDEESHKKLHRKKIYGMRLGIKIIDMCLVCERGEYNSAVWWFNKVWMMGPIFRGLTKDRFRN